MRCPNCTNGHKTGDVFVYPEDDCGTYTVPAEYASLRESRQRHKVLEEREYECRECDGTGICADEGEEIATSNEIERAA